MTALKWKAFCTSLHWTHTTSPCPHFSLRSLIASSFWFHKAHFICSPLGHYKVGAAYQVLAGVPWWPWALCLPPGFQDFTKGTACLCREGWAICSFLPSWNKQYLLFFHLLEFCPRAKRNPWYIVGVHWWMSKTEVANSYLRGWSLDYTVRVILCRSKPVLFARKVALSIWFFY